MEQTPQVEIPQTALVKIDPKEFGLDENQGSTIFQAFTPKIIERSALEVIYRQMITKELSADLSKEAGTLRRQLVKVRTGIAEIHKTQKAFFLAGGRFADTIKNKETLPIEQMEEKLYEIEKWAEIQEEKRVDALKAERLETLKQFEVDGSMMALGHMTDDIWTNYLSGVKLNYEAKKQAEAKAEADRIEAARIEAERLETQRLENIRLKAEAEEKEKELEAERIKTKAISDKAEADKAKADAEAKKAKDKADKDAATAKAIADKAIAEAKAIADKLAAELKAKADAEAKIKADAIKAEKLAKAMPDKIKLKALAEVIRDLPLPEMKTVEMKEIVIDVKKLLCKIETFINEKISA